MKVSNNFKNIIDEQALLVVTGTKTAHIHLLKNGQVKEEDSMVIETPKYSDDEGFDAEMSAAGNIRGVTSTYNNQKDYLATKFLKTLRDHVKEALQKYNVNKIYLFGPEFFIGQEEHIFPQEIRKNIVSEFKGNFTNESINNLLKKIENMYKKENDIANSAQGEARQILSNTGAI